MKNSFWKLIITLLAISSPILILIQLYLIYDPFKVLYHYDRYYETNTEQVLVNRDFASTETLINQSTKHSFDSYIFGNSRSLGIICLDWEGKTNGIAYHFDSNGESTLGIIGKIRFIVDKFKKLKYCIVVLDSSTVSQTTNDYEQPYVKHPLVSRESRLKFQYTFLTTFLSNKFFIPFLFWKAGISIPNFFEYPQIFEKPVFTFDSINNDTYFTVLENDISENSDAFYEKYKGRFYRSNSNVSETYPPLIGDIQKTWFAEMKEIFSKHGTNYKVIIYPDYNQKYFNKTDIRFLEETFGKENVFDFSGKNKFTDDFRNYYDEAHCRPILGREMLKIMYPG